MENELADVLRWFGMVLGVLLIGFSGSIIQQARKFRAPSAHIYYISISYGVLVIFAIVEQYLRLGSGPSWRIITTGLGFGFGLFAMVSMYRFYQPDNRAKRHSEGSLIRAGEVLDEVEKRLTEEGVENSVEQGVREKLQDIRGAEQDAREVRQDKKESDYNGNH